MSHKIKQVFFSVFFYGNRKWIEYTKYLSIIFHNTLLVVYEIKIILLYVPMKWPCDFWCTLVFEVPSPAPVDFL